MAIDSKERFSDRADNYAKYRPEYPAEAIDWIIAETEVTADSVIADLGAGTGKFTKLLVKRGLRTLAVEPNAAMREAAEVELSCYENFAAVNGSAEETTLADASVDLITAAQAFHWFDKARCRVEFKRILKPGGAVALIWNKRSYASEFMDAYLKTTDSLRDENLARDKKNTTREELDAFFGGGRTKREFDWTETLGFDALWGLQQSRSECPAPGHPNYEPLKAALRELFDRYQTDGAVQYLYRADVIIGKL